MISVKWVQEKFQKCNNVSLEWILLLDNVCPKKPLSYRKLDNQQKYPSFNKDISEKLKLLQLNKTLLKKECNLH